MALTVEEKLKRLHDWSEWEIYSPEDKGFLEGIANNLDPAAALRKVKPELPLTGRGSAPFHASRLMGYKRIQAGLEVIQYVAPKPTYDRREALEEITYRLRKQGLDDETYIKLISIYAKMNGWDKPKDLPPTPEEKEEDVNQAVVDAERKRRNGEEN